MKDALGNELTVGDIVTKPGRSGSSMWVNRYLLINIEPNQVKAVRFGVTRGGTFHSTRNVTLDRLNNFTKVHPDYYPDYIKGYLENVYCQS